MSQTVCIDWKHILSRVRVSVRPSNFLYAKNSQKPARIPSRLRDCSLEWTSEASKCGHGWSPQIRRTCDNSIIAETDRTKNESVYLHARLRLTWQITHMSATATDRLLAIDALDQVICTCIYKLRCRARQNRRKATSQNGHNDSLYLHGLKSVV